MASVVQVVQVVRRLQVVQVAQVVNVVQMVRVARVVRAVLVIKFVNEMYFPSFICVLHLSIPVSGSLDSFLAFSHYFFSGPVRCFACRHLLSDSDTKYCDQDDFHPTDCRCERINSKVGFLMR